MQKADIENRENIVQLIDSFYTLVRADKQIGPIFQQIIGDDWRHHLPVMYSFWETVLLGKAGYMGNPVKNHIEIDSKVQLTEEHYNRWLKLFNAAVDSLFEGTNATEIKRKALMMQQLISMKVDMARDGKLIV